MTPGQAFIVRTRAPRAGGQAFPIGGESRGTERCAIRGEPSRGIRAHWSHDLLRRPSPSSHGLEPGGTEERWPALGDLTVESRSLFGSPSEVLPRLIANKKAAPIGVEAAC